ncbi:MAG: CpsB/CapC family capsule biosynthesis tyrosine phosphatase [Polyangiaceae bacterium]
MPGFVDLHCHWIAQIDDGARSPEESISMLRGLREAGFSRVVATPHMRPGMFDNDREKLMRAFDLMKPHLDAAGESIPEVSLASEHYFDDVVFQRLIAKQALPFPGGKAALIELPTQTFPARVHERLLDVKRSGIIVVLAHPERYRPIWDDVSVLEPLIDVGVRLQLDVCALVGKYGKKAQETAELLLEEEAYEIGASDAHKQADIDIVVKAIARLEALVGKDETTRLMSTAPHSLSS